MGNRGKTEESGSRVAGIAATERKREGGQPRRVAAAAQSGKSFNCPEHANTADHLKSVLELLTPSATAEHCPEAAWRCGYAAAHHLAVCFTAELYRPFCKNADGQPAFDLSGMPHRGEKASTPAYGGGAPHKPSKTQSHMIRKKQKIYFA